jgi:predicted RNase H-like nuclease (RuvC/YqgF family)
MNIENHNSNENNFSQRPDNSKRIMLAVIAALLVVIIGLGVWFAISTAANKEAVEAEKNAREAAELSLQQDLANSEFEGLEQEFSNIENPRQMIVSDSVKMRLTEKYEAARLEVEKLQRELKNTKTKSAKELEDLRGQIKTLRALLKHYIEEIDRLNKENEALRTENAEIKGQNERLSSQVQETSRQNEQLSKRMTLAEKLNVTGVNLSALNSKGKAEKKVQKAKQLMVTFTIPQNNSTPVGEKTIYMRITTPEGQLLDGGGSFHFEGGSVSCSAKKSVEYGGEEIAGIHIYYDVRTALNPGTYTVELFADNYRLTSRQFTLK